MIFFNVPEKDTSTVDTVETDKQFVLDLCSESLGMETNISISDLQRFGSKPKSADDRLLKVVIRDNDTRGTILKNAHMLKDSSKAVHKKVGIGKDLTRTQREHNKALRQKLNKMKKDFPNKKWAIIRRDKVIELPGAPLKGGTAGISPNRAAAGGPPTGSATWGGSK